VRSRRSVQLPEFDYLEAGSIREDEFRFLQETLEMVSDFGLGPSGGEQSAEGEEMASASAVLNAICRAMKADLNQLPVTPRRIPTALDSNGTKSFSGSRRRQSIS
jgi:hypothetical protein